MAAGNSAFIQLIPIYDGKTSVTDFASTATSITKLAGWNDAQSINIIYIRLQGQAKKFAHSLLAETSLDTFLTKLKNQFDTPKDTSLGLQDLVTGILQKDGETVREFAQRVRELKQASYTGGRDSSQHDSGRMCKTVLFARTPSFDPQVRYFNITQNI